MSLIRRKDRKSAMFKLLPPETWQEQSKADLGEDWPLDEDDSKHVDLMTRMHARRRESAVKDLENLFEKHGGLDLATFKILDVIPVLYMGWECDQYAWVVRNKGKKYMVGTSHGSPYLMTRDELQKKIFEYEQAIVHTNKAIAELEA